VSGHIAGPAGPISQGETTMRTSIISIAAIALVAIVAMPSIVIALSGSAHQQFHVKDVRTIHPIHAPLLAS
jgi:hypothetical protein